MLLSLLSTFVDLSIANMSVICTTYQAVWSRPAGSQHDGLMATSHPIGRSHAPDPGNWADYVRSSKVFSIASFPWRATTWIRFALKTLAYLLCILNRSSSLPCVFALRDLFVLVLMASRQGSVSTTDSILRSRKPHIVRYV
jgi:hypothetical protein